MRLWFALHIGLALCLAPLLLGVINRVKALFAGRRGRPLLQTYFDLVRLLRKGRVLSPTTTWVFRAGPVLALAAPLAALTLLPLAGRPGLFAFSGDFVLLAYLLGISRFATILAALDTGSSFEGMGASREMTFGALAEPVLFLTLLTAGSLGGGTSLVAILGGAAGHPPMRTLLLAGAMFILLLAENCRIPVDDPNTHLELTMIHEVMVLDHSGPDLACIVWGAALKLWVHVAVLVGLLLGAPTGLPAADVALFLAAMLGVAVLVGVVESTMARLSLPRVPKLLVGAGALSALALILAMWR